MTDKIRFAHTSAFHVKPAWRWIVFAMIAVNANLLHSQINIRLDMSSLSGTYYHFNGPGVNYSDTADGIDTISLAMAGSCQIDLNPAGPWIGRVAFYVNGSGVINNVNFYDDGTQTSGYEPLHASFYNISGNTLALTGKRYAIDMLMDSLQAMKVLGLDSSAGTVAASTRDSISLMPGNYKSVLINDSSKTVEAVLAFSIRNQITATDSTVLWKDILGNQTEGAFKALDTTYYKKDTGMLKLKDKPPTDPPPHNQYATLKPKLDAGFFQLINGKLWFKFEERYNESGDLKYRIFDKQGTDVTPATALTKYYGVNFLQLDLLNDTNYSVGEFYILEVWDSKNEVTRLRFKYSY